VLVLRALGIGDLLTAVPALRGIGRAWPEHQLVLATSAWLEPLVDLVDCVDVLLPAEELTPIEWAGAPPDVAVDLHGCGPESHRLLAALQPGRLVAFGCRSAGVAGPAFDPDEHEVRRWARLVEQATGTRVDPGDLAIREPDRSPAVEGAAVVHVGASAGARRWPAERFAEVTAWLDARELPVVLTGGPADVATAREVVAAAGLGESISLAGRTDLADLAALVAHARLVVSGDTGVAHLATAYGRPSVTLFGPVHPAHWGPPDDPRHRVLAAAGTGTGDPHARAVDPALTRIGVSDVVRELEALLARELECSVAES
jgi:ADP-heptose:LPS heptosyltransferase